MMFSVLFCLLGLDSTGSTSFRLSSRPRMMKNIFDFEKMKVQALTGSGKGVNTLHRVLNMVGVMPSPRY